MAQDHILFHLNNWPVTLLHAEFALAALVLSLLFVMLFMAMRVTRQRRQDAHENLRRAGELEYRLAELSGSLQGFASQTQSLQMQMQHQLDERMDQVSQRVSADLTQQTDRTSLSLHALHERLAVIDAAQTNLTNLSTEMISLKDILSNKQTRGAFGQGRMEAIIKDGLHTKSFEFQATLSNGTRPDCVIMLPDSSLRLVVDAKFPLEAYNAMRNASDDNARKLFETQLRNDVMRHVKDIADKYLISGETHETALMFVPSESIYADLHERFEDTVQRAFKHRVILASPNVLMLLIQTLQAIIKDASMREQAHVIKLEVVKLLEDVTRLKERTVDLKKHFEQAGADIERIGVSTDRISKRGMRIENLELEESMAEIQVASQPKLVRSP